MAVSVLNLTLVLQLLQNQRHEIRMNGKDERQGHVMFTLVQVGVEVI